MNGFSDNCIDVLHGVFRQNRRCLAFLDRQRIGCRDADMIAAERQAVLAFFAVEIECHLVGKYVTEFFEFIRDFNFCCDTGLHALDELIDLVVRTDAVAVSRCNIFSFCAVGRCDGKFESLIVAVRVDMHILQPFEEVVALPDLSREVHIHLVDRRCRMVCQCRIGVADDIFLSGDETVAVRRRNIFSPRITGNSFDCTVCLLRTEGIVRKCICLAVFLRFNRDLNSVRIEIFNGIVFAGFVRALIPPDIGDAVRCIVRNRRGTEVQLFSDDRCLNAADLKEIIVINNRDFEGDLFIVQTCKGDCRLACFAAEEELAAAVQRCDRGIRIGVFPRIAESDGRLVREMPEGCHAEIILAFPDIREIVGSLVPDQISQLGCLNLKPDLIRQRVAVAEGCLSLFRFNQNLIADLMGFHFLLVCFVLKIIEVVRIFHRGQLCRIGHIEIIENNLVFAAGNTDCVVCDRADVFAAAQRADIADGKRCRMIPCHIILSVR